MFDAEVADAVGMAGDGGAGTTALNAGAGVLSNFFAGAGGGRPAPAGH